MNNIVYWIRLEEHTDPYKDGYVGVTSDLQTRYATHIRNNRVPNNSIIEILYEGSREECFKKELELRPKPKIGWNNAVGGSHGWKTGFKHSQETKEKLKAAWTDERKIVASEWKKEFNKTLIGQKRPKQSKAISGKNNPMFGKKHSEKTRKKISESNKGRTPPNKTEIYCIYCRKREPMSILKKYHGLGKKACKND